MLTKLAKLVEKNWPTYCRLAWALVATASFFRSTVATNDSGGSDMARRVLLATGPAGPVGTTRMGLGRPDGSRGDPAVGGRPQDTLLVAPPNGDDGDGRGPTVSPCSSSSSSTLITLNTIIFPLKKKSLITWFLPFSTPWWIAAFIEMVLIYTRTFSPF